MRSHKTQNHKTFRLGTLPLFLIPALMAGLMPARAAAATLVVTNTSDSGAGGCTGSSIGDGCTLREAISAANDQTLTPGDDTIDATGISGNITLLAALPALSTNIILNGSGASSLTVQRSGASGTPEFRIFTIDNTTTSGPTVTISGFTIAGGRVSGGTAPANCGGGIYNNHGTLTVSNSVLSGNSATAGGAICNDGSLSVNARLTLSNSTLSNNIATTGGGALFNNGSGGGSAPLVISDSTFSGNRATNGGAILNDGRSGGSATITQFSNSVLSGNVATGDGGAIENNGTTGGSATLVITFSTLSGNTATNGGAIQNNGVGGSATQAIRFSTLSGNTASVNGGAINNDGRTAGSATLTAAVSTFNGNSAGAKGGAINNDGRVGSATVEIDNSTVAANAASGTSGAIDSDGTGGSATLAIGSTILSNGSTANIFIQTVNAQTTFSSKGNNLSSDAAGGNGTTAPGGLLSAGSDIRNTDPQLGALQNNGGPTQTRALLAGSPAIDKGFNRFPTDQRGFAIVGIADIGAFEFSGVQPVLPTIDLNGAAAGTGVTTAFTEQTPVVIAPDVTVTAPGATIKSASIQLGINPDNASETLSATVTNTAIIATYNSTTRTLSLSGVDTIARYRQVLAGVTYNNTSDAPNTTNRTVTFSVNDGAQNSTSATATLTVTPANDAPIAAAQSVATAEDTAKSIVLSATDVDNTSLTFRIVTALARGTLSGSGANLTYTPNANFNGSDSFVFVANDGQTDSAAATVSITVSAVNDAPIAQDQSTLTGEDMPKAIVLGATDVDNTTLTFSLVTQPANGSLSGSGANLTYTPNADFVGRDSFTFKANDGAADSNIATVSITVGTIGGGGTNDAPVARDDNFTSSASTPLTIAAPGVLANDFDVDGDALRAVIVARPSRGTLTLNIDGSFTYTPESGFTGSDSFTYRASDGTLQSNVATVTIQVTDGTGGGGTGGGGTGGGGTGGGTGGGGTGGGTTPDTTAPVVAFTAPVAGQILQGFAALRGTASDTQSGVREVRVALLRERDGRYWTGRNWSRTLFLLPTNLEGNNWSLAVSLPIGFNLTDGKYFLGATAVDNAGNSGSTQFMVRVDKNAPSVSFTFPTNGARVPALPYVTGRSIEGPGGVGTVSVSLYIKRSGDGKYFSGRNWSTTAVALSTRLEGNSFSRNGSVSQPLPSGANLKPGVYFLTAVAVDRAGNRGTTTISITVAAD